MISSPRATPSAPPGRKSFWTSATSRPSPGWRSMSILLDSYCIVLPNKSFSQLPPERDAERVLVQSNGVRPSSPQCRSPRHGFLKGMHVHQCQLAAGLGGVGHTRRQMVHDHAGGEDVDGHVTPLDRVITMIVTTPHSPLVVGHVFQAYLPHVHIGPSEAGAIRRSELAGIVAGGPDCRCVAAARA